MTSDYEKRHRAVGAVSLFADGADFRTGFAIILTKRERLYYRLTVESVYSF